MQLTRLLFILLVLSGCATPISKGSHCIVEPGYLVDESTFSWYSTPAVELDDQTGYVSPAMLKVLEDAVVAKLNEKGFRLIDATATDREADVQVALNLKTRRELYSMTSNQSTCLTSDCWEHIDVGSNLRMDVRTVGFLSADVYHLGEPIWRGWVERSLSPADRDSGEVVIDQAVPALLESFPP